MANRASSDADDTAIDPALPEKKRARRRLVGAAVVGLAAIIGLTLILDAEPRRAGTDVAVQIPSRDTPLIPTSPAPARADAAADTRPAPKVEPKAEPKADSRPDAARPDPKAADAKAAPEPKAAARADKPDPKAAKAEPKADPKADARADAKSDAKTDPKADAKAKAAEARKAAQAEKAAQAAQGEKAAQSAKADKADKAAKNDGADGAAAGQRFFLQIGAYGTDKSARQQVDRAREAGVRAYTERVKTKDGERVRVRVGPFSSRDAAEQARAKLKLVGMDSAVVAL